MTEPTDALLPCPFCGEAAKRSFNSLYGDMSMASCKSCGATAYAPKWNRRTPAPVGVEPIARLEIGKTKGGVSLTHIAEPAAFQLPEGMYALYTTPQPTQAQAGAVPLTDAQADSIAMAAFEKHCGRLHPWEGAQPWVIAAIKAADGIKGKTT